MTDETPTPAAPRIAKEVTAPQTGTDTVVVACKMPNGIVIRAFEKVEEVEATPTGHRNYHIVKGIPGTEFKCDGPASIAHQPANIVDMLGRNFPGNFALTAGCPADVWRNWLHWNQGTPLVTEGLIFALPDAGDAAQEAKSRASIRSGLEPINPENPAASTGIRGIQPGVPSAD